MFVGHFYFMELLSNIGGQQIQVTRISFPAHLSLTCDATALFTLTVSSTLGMIGGTALAAQAGGGAMLLGGVDAAGEMLADVFV